MALNLTGIDEDLYFAANTAFNIGLFFIDVLPTFVLCMLCVIALVLTKNLVYTADEGSTHQHSYLEQRSVTGWLSL